MNELKEAELREREAERQDALAALEEALASIEAQHREPDQWERVCLAAGIAVMFSVAYRLAETEAVLAMTPPSGRSLASNLPSDPLYNQCNLALLKDMMRRARAEPLKRYAHLGPVQFTGEGRS